MNADFDFSGKVVLITGGTGSLGAATARAFAEAGARVVLVDRDVDRQHEMYSDWAEAGHHVLISPINLLVEEETDEAVSQAIAQAGAIDILVNTVGGYQAGDTTADTSLETWNHMMGLNARSVFLCCRAVIPHMLEQGGGKIINVAARSGLKGSAKQSAYAASKSAVISLTETMAAELRKKGINVNCILPGTIDTPDNRAAMPDADVSRWVQPESLAAVIQFLASDAAQDVHGAALPVYGRS